MRYTVNKFDSSKEKTIKEITEEIYGPLDDYTDFAKTRSTKLVNGIYNYSSSYFMEKDEKVYFKHEVLGKNINLIKSFSSTKIYFN